MMVGGRLLRALTRNRAGTADEPADSRLRARTYAVPFEHVWQASLWLATSRRGWEVLSADDVQGRIRAEARTLLRFVHDVVIDVTLDENGQTRLDMTSSSRSGKVDFGKNARRIGKFLRGVDRVLARRRPAPRPRSAVAREA